jgi:RNA polymerase sigma-70 factor (ECF subfamily)
VSSCLEPGAEVLPEAGSRAAPAAEKYAFSQLYEQHFDQVMAFVLRFGIRAEDAEDLVQRVFVVALRRYESAEPIEQPVAWLRAVALRVVHEHFRWWKVRRAGQWLLEQSWAGRQDDEVSPERDVLANESLHRIRQVLHRMSSKLRDAFVLLDIDGMSARDAAQLLGISHNTMRSRHNLAREEFRRLWYGGGSSLTNARRVTNGKCQPEGENR